MALVGMMSVVTAASTFAAGVGYVNFAYLVQHHRDFPKYQAQMQGAIKTANDEWKQKAASLKTDQDRQALENQLAQRLNQLETSLYGPIQKDIVDKTEQVRKDKNLDCIVVQGQIIAGEDNAIDETSEVGKLIQ
jgi:outer membrane protein